MKVRVRPKSWADLEEESAYLAGHAGEAIAVRWASSVWQRVEELKPNPLLGRLRLDLPFPGIRSWRVEDYPNWALFYTASDEASLLLRLRHGAMDLPRLDFAS